MSASDFADVSGFFADFGTSASWRGQGGASTAITSVVIVDAPGELLLQDVGAIDYVVTYRQAEWPTVRGGDRVVIGATHYEVRDALPIDDGVIARAALRRLN